MTSIHAVTVFILSFIVSIKDFATLPAKKSLILGLSVTALLTAATFVGVNEIWLPILVGITGLVSIYANRTAGGIFGIAPAYVAIAGFLVSGGDHWIVPVFALIGFGYAYLVQHLTKIKLKHTAMSKKSAIRYGVFLAITAAAATWISIQLSAPHPYWFVIAAIMVLHPQHKDTIRVMWKRSLATVVGALIAIVILHFLPPVLIIIITVITAVLFFCYLLLNKYFTQIALITVLLLLVLSANSPDPSNDLSLTRIWLTLAGTGFAAVLYVAGFMIVRVTDKKK